MMDDLPVETAPGPARMWSGFGCAGVALMSFALFVVVQVVAGIVVLVHVHPEVGRMFQQAMRGIPPTPITPKITDAWMRDFAAAPYLFLYALLGDGAMAAVAIWLGKSWLPATLGDLGFRRLGPTVVIGGGVLAGFAMILLSTVVSGAQTRFFGPHTEKVAELLLTHHGALSFLFDFLSVAVIAPFAEELLFRGIIFAGLAQRMPVWSAAGLSGLIFGAAHFDKWSLLPLAAIGAGLALLYRRTGSLWPNIIAHATVNIVALLTVYFAPQFAT